MNGSDFIKRVERKLASKRNKKITKGQIATHLGISVPALMNWQKRKNITARQMVGVLFKSQEKAVERAEKQAIQPIVEFFKLDPADSRDGAQMEVFGLQVNGEKDHPYRLGLRKELTSSHGVYVFYDSRGSALYVGKAHRQTLWREINNAFNRDRSVQTIRRVAHPTTKRSFRTTDEMKRQIRPCTVPLHDLAVYFSAYYVVEGLIGNLESLLIRGFANDLLNVKMENLKWEND